jgi:hypothetical protein
MDSGLAACAAPRNDSERYNPNIAFAMMFFWISFEPP